ncbi:glutathione S-transferase family protein [Aquicoccus porphyridii]|uniref:Glutathione S-transferase family protein n=1 Tax=Aquicoccus porphyridii TaxID=1852029 RepID=A0A5A9ZJL7_9RHOB|nr:glutathione S-transferase family protein [Aquicoccus porphyridii]KAA0917503.1 glutathione S-transferase family protein [Aquicoccus porphyridii]RAI55585.1 glutathione S-transferase family protein [Rhodobacteraceae bacterium AsT-22]
MPELTLTTLNWVPDLPRGYVRDLRVRWALEEVGLPYRVQSVPFIPSAPFRELDAEQIAQQPFAQVPWLSDGDQTIFESGAILLYLGERSAALLPTDPHARQQAINWVFAALNSVEAASLPWSIYQFSNDTEQTPGRKHLDAFLQARLQYTEQVLAGREWLAGEFSIADILMADVLRLVHRFDGLANVPACRAYVARATARPAFEKAYADQMAHFAAED